MRITHRIARLEERHQVGTDRDGHCRFCHGREKELGGQHVVINEHQDVEALMRRFPSRPNPGPTPCPRCGRDLNTYVVIQYVNRLTPEQMARAAAQEGAGGTLDS